MYTEQRHKSAELVPACIEFSPFFEISRSWFFIPVFYSKSADIHTPVRKTGHREIYPGSDLHLHIMPAAANITAPCSSGITLYTGKCRTGKDENTFIRICCALTLINPFGIYQGVSIE